MEELRFCPGCGSEIVPGDRFCGECGISILTPSASKTIEQAEQSKATPPSVNQQPAATPASQFTPAGLQIGGQQPAAAGNTANLGVKNDGNRNALVIVISVLVVLLAVGVGLYWGLSRGKDPDQASLPPAVTQDEGITTTSGQVNAPAPVPVPVVDLSRASTYLSEPGLKCTFFVNYPDGMSGVVERYSAGVVSHEAVRVSEVETGVERGEIFGYGFHYVERTDGTYYILDQTPNEIFPVLKNNLTVGQTWHYQDEFGGVTWTVADMGVNLDLGFAAFEDCLLIQEDNQSVGFQSISYYAPGKGIVLVIDPNGTMEYYRLTAQEKVDPILAAETVIKWCPNYGMIKDDRTQSY